MATPPTRVSYNVPSSGNFSSSTTPKTTNSFDIVTGDLLVVIASMESNLTPTSVTPSTSAGSVTWTTQATQTGVSDSNRSGAVCWTGAVTAGATGITVSCARPSSASATFWGVSATVWRDHGGVGVVYSGNNAAGSTAPSVAATCSANSAVQCGVNDWNAADGTVRTWRTINGAPQSEALYFRDSLHHASYGGYSLDVGAGGSITQGLTAPSTMRWVLVGVEILGTTAAAYPFELLTHTPRAY